MNKLYVIGIGPGSYEQLTIQAARILRECEVVIGYSVYVELVREWLPQKEYLTTPMKKEIERCRMAFEESRKGRDTAMVCSGDAGIYGMAGPILELKEEYPDVEVEIVSGVTAASAGAAVLGAPLMHDFAVISLSDLLTPWEQIEKRIEKAAEADFVICIYNPSSRKRAGYLERACRMVLKYKAEDTVCGLVRSIGREGQSASIMDLKTLSETKVDMFTTVYIGNSSTAEKQGRMVTPRGYQI